MGLYLFLIFFIIILFFHKKELLLWVPFISIVIDIVPYYLTGEINSTDKSIIFLSYFRGFLISLPVVFLFFSRKTRIDNLISLSIFLYIIYNLLRQLFTEEIYLNIKLAILLSVYISVIPAAFNYFSKVYITFSRLKNLLRIVLFLYILNCLYCTFLNTGVRHGYENTIISLGSFDILSEYGIMYIILFLISFYKKLRKLDFILIIFSIILIVLTAKRTPIYLLVVGISIIIFFNRQSIFKSKNSIIYLSLFGIILYVTVSAFIFVGKNIRTKASNIDYINEGRYLEYSVIENQLLKHGSYQKLLFGEDNSFNSSFISNINLTRLDVEDRKPHSDIAILVFSSGFIGLFLYVFVLYSLFRKQMSLQKSSDYKESKSAFWAIFVSLVLNLFADSYTVCSARVIPYLLLGICLGLQNTMSKKLSYPVFNENSTSFKQFHI